MFVFFVLFFGCVVVVGRINGHISDATSESVSHFSSNSISPNLIMILKKIKIFWANFTSMEYVQAQRPPPPPVFHMGLRPQDVLWPPSHIILTARHIALFSKSFVNCLVPYFGAVRSISALLFYRLWSDAQVVVLRSRDLLRVIPQTRLFLFHSNRISPQCLFFDIPCLTACSVSIWPPVIPWLLKLELNVGSSKKKKKSFFFVNWM